MDDELGPDGRPLTEKEKKALERKKKQERADLEKTITTLNTKYRAQFSNPDKHLKYGGVLTVSYTRNNVDETKKIMAQSDQPSSALIPQLLEKFLIKENLHQYSLFQRDTAAGTETLIPDNGCPLKVTLEWGEERYGQFALFLRLDPAKKNLKAPTSPKMDEAVKDEADALDDYGYANFYRTLEGKFSAVGDLARITSGMGEELIANKDRPERLGDMGPQVVGWATKIKELIAEVTNASHGLQGVPLKHIETYKNALIEVLKQLVMQLKAVKAKPATEVAVELVNRTREAKALCALAKDMLVGASCTQYLQQQTGFVMTKDAKGGIYVGSKEICPLFIQQMARATLWAVVQVVERERTTFSDTIGRLLMAAKRLTDTLKTTADYVLAAEAEDMQRDEACLGRSIDQLLVNVRIASGFWPPPAAMENMLASCYKVLTAFATLIFTAKRRKLLRNTKYNGSQLLEEPFMKLLPMDISDDAVRAGGAKNTSTVTDSTPVSRGAIPLEKEQKALREAYDINSAIASTLTQLVATLDNARAALHAAVQEKNKAFYATHAKEVVDGALQVKSEVEAMEYVRVKKDTEEAVQASLRPIMLRVRDVTLSTMIATGVWPPPDAEERMLDATERLLSAVKMVPSAAQQAVDEERELLDIMARQMEEAESRRRANLNAESLRMSVDQNLKGVSAAGVGVKADVFQKMLGFPESKDIEWDENMKDTTRMKRVKGATLDMLVYRLTFHGEPDLEFIEAFMLTFHSFTTPHDLMDKLIVRYNISIPAALSKEQAEQYNSQVVVQTRLRIFNVLKWWLNKCFDDFFNDPTLVAKFNTFTELMSKDLRSAASNLQKLMERNRLYGAEKAEAQVHSVPAPTPILPKKWDPANVDITEVDALEIARQLTLIEFDIYKRIQPKETMGLSWNIKERQHNSKNILHMITRANDVAVWVACEILKHTDLKKRVKALCHMIAIAEQCLAIKNFNALFTLVSALGSASILRLKKTWAAVPAKTMELFHEMQEIVSDKGNYSTYRGRLTMVVDAPCIPFLGIYLTDLTFIEEGNPSKLPSGLLNFNKRRLFAGVILLIQGYQRIAYNLTVANTLHKYLYDLDLPWQEAQLYEQSLKVEGRDED